MKTKAIILSVISLVFIISGSILVSIDSSNNSTSNTAPLNAPQEVKREIVQYPINPDVTAGVSAGTLPEFVLDIAASKFQNVLASSQEKLKDLVEVRIVHEMQASSLEAEVTTDVANKKLKVHPSQIANFKPGLYRLSVKMRTLEGDVDLEQDFAWGVIAVNSHKSVYGVGETAKIGIGVVDDAGETQCLYGFNHVTDLSMTITDPQKKIHRFSIKDETIKDSGECGSVTVTNEADFQAIFKTSVAGIYQIKVEALVKGKARSIVDYFKVDPAVKFDVERTSFPTRIYPPTIYPNTMSITAKEYYKGQIVDIVPASFVIEQISDGGRLENVGDFTRIVWDLELQKGVKKNLTYFIKYPMVSPEFYLIGPLTIKSGSTVLFTEARQWQIAADAINSTSGLVTYEDNASSNTWSRIWTGTTWSPTLGSTATSMSTVPGDGRWFVEKSSPKTGEKIVALIDNVGPDRLILFTWSGSAWALDKNFPLVSSAADVTRPMDVAYEELSGDALIVYSDYSNAQLKFYKRVGGVWDAGNTAAAGGNAGTAYDVYKRWVRLEPQFGSDTILVGYLNNNERVGAMLWDGSTNTFGDQFADNVGTVTATSDEQAFDIAWETQSGTPMIFWGTTGNLLTMREFTGGTWQAETTVASGFTNDLDWVMAAADPIPTSNNIALGLQDNTACRARFGMWTGAAATMNGTVPTCASAVTNNLVDTAFEKDTGQAMWVYVSSATTNQISWLTWTSGGGFTAATTEAGTTTGIESISLYGDLNTNSMMLLYHDNSAASSNCQLWHREWDGTSWSAKNANPVHANMCASADNDTIPYGFGFDRNLETLAAYRWFANNNGTSVVTALTSQDTAYTLTTANEAFRLRLLIYTPDTLALNLRNYKLQYVDPGVGTCSSPSGGTPSSWTDVPASGGQISFNNNASPADGATLTTNVGDPTYLSLPVNAQDYLESNPFTNSVTIIDGDEVGLWDFSLIDNTSYDRVAQSFCFRVARTSDVVLQIGLYPQISTAAVDDVLIQGGSQINQGTSVNNL